MRSAPGLQTIIIYAKLPSYSIALDRNTGIRVIKYNRNTISEGIVGTALYNSTGYLSPDAVI